MSTQTRQPQGQPTGGQFASRHHTESDVELAPGLSHLVNIGDRMAREFAEKFPEATEEQKQAIGNLVTSALLAGEHPADWLGIDVPDEHRALAAAVGAPARSEMAKLVWAAARAPEARAVRDLARAHAAGIASASQEGMSDDEFADTLLKDIDEIADRWTGTYRELRRLGTWAQTQRGIAPTPVPHRDEDTVRAILDGRGISTEGSAEEVARRVVNDRKAIRESGMGPAAQERVLAWAVEVVRP